MTAITLTFPAGRFHATPWSRHVNEGAPEWPPSPWRLLRSFVAVWKRKLDDRLDEPTVRALLEKLSAPPVFHLPQAVPAHTRHYMPLYDGKRTLVFDSFLAIGKEEKILVAWNDVSLDTQESEALSPLLENLGFLGRAESWCSASFATEEEQKALSQKCPKTFPLGENERMPDGYQAVRVLCADPKEAFENTQNPHETKTEGRGKNKTSTTIPLYSPDWHLCAETLWLHEKRWSQPPGSRWITYARPSDCFKPEPVRLKTVRKTKPQPQVLRFALDSAVLPSVTDTIRVAENARRALMGLCGKLTEQNGIRGKSATLSGKSEEGERLTDHTHAYYLPTDEDDDGRLDHLTIYAQQGFGDAELRAAQKLLELRSRDREESGHPLRTLLLGWGLEKEFHPGPLASSKIWLSATPYIATRHPKTRGKAKWLGTPADFLLEDLKEEIARWCKLHNLSPDAVSISPILDANGVFRLPDPLDATGRPHPNRLLRPLQFHRFRQKRNDDGGRRLSGFFRIEFPQSIQGPIALGHSSHFGLGLFTPIP